METRRSGTGAVPFLEVPGSTLMNLALFEMVPKTGTENRMGWLDRTRRLLEEYF